MEFSGWLSDELKKRGWSDRELSRRAGISKTTASELANGQRRPSERMVRCIAKALGESEERALWIAGLIDIPPTSDEQWRELGFIYRDLEPTSREELLALGRVLKDRDAARYASKQRPG